MRLPQAATLAVCALLISSDACAIFRERDTVPVFHAIVDICAMKFPEYKDRNAAAFAAWTKRNRRAVDEARKAPTFDLYVIGFSRMLTDLQGSPWAQTCSEFAASLDKAESDIRSGESSSFASTYTNIPEGFEVQQAFELKRLCDQKRPEHKAANDAALAKWIAENKARVELEQAEEWHARASRAVRAVLENKVGDWNFTCRAYNSILQTPPFTHARMPARP